MKVDEYQKGDPYNFTKGSVFHRLRLKNTVDIVKNLPGEDVLDFGCGKGFITYEVSKIKKNILGLDHSKKAIDFAKKFFKKVKFRLGNSSFLSRNKSSYDIVIMNNIIEHIPLNEHSNILRSIYNVLRDKGYCVISTPNYYSLYNLIRLSLGKPINFRNEDHTKEFSIPEMKELLKEAGFNEIRIKPQFQFKSFKENKIAPLWNIVNWTFMIFGLKHLCSTAFYIARK